MISQTTEYALRAVVYLAGQRGASCTTQQIAAATQVPSGYLSKVLQGLSRAGLVDAQRGLRGGFRLLNSPTELTMLDVMNAIDPFRKTDPSGFATHEPDDVNLLPLQEALFSITHQTEDLFRAVVIADLVKADS
ncbi:HTH-type transcriptional regulator IscR [Planctomycetales bacterium 10988]|nr:HTH-type transcriptional regulator IscR [Planctomycetales bacterium 10988]